MAPTGDLVRTPGMCPDRESNQQLLDSQPVLNPLSHTSQGPISFFKEIEQKVARFVWNHKTPKSQSNPQEKEQSRRYHSTCPQIILQRYDNQNSLVLAEELTSGIEMRAQK